MAPPHITQIFVSERTKSQEVTLRYVFVADPPRVWLYHRAHLDVSTHPKTWRTGSTCCETMPPLNWGGGPRLGSRNLATAFFLVRIPARVTLYVVLCYVLHRHTRRRDQRWAAACIICTGVVRQLPYTTICMICIRPPWADFSMIDTSTVGKVSVARGSISLRAFRRRADSVRYWHPLGCQAIELGKPPQGCVVHNFFVCVISTPVCAARTAVVLLLGDALLCCTSPVLDACLNLKTVLL